MPGIIGKGVQFPCGPAAVTDEPYLTNTIIPVSMDIIHGDLGITVCHWETGKERYGKDSGARRPALHEECIGYERWPGAKRSAFYPKRIMGLLFSTGFCARGGGRKRYFFVVMRAVYSTFGL